MTSPSPLPSPGPSGSSPRPGLLRHISAALCLVVLILAPSIRATYTAGSADSPSPADVPEDKVVYLIPMGSLHEHDVQFLAEGLRARLGVQVALLPPEATPGRAFVASRSQYDAGLILDALFEHQHPEAWLTLAVTSEDIATDDVEMVYGYASSGDRAAVLSTFRFRHDLASESVARRARAHDQLIRAAVHELGHTQGMEHCPRAGCLMGEIAHRDEITPRTALCEPCARRLAAQLRGPRDRRAELLQRGDRLLTRGLPYEALRLYEGVLAQDQGHPGLDVYERAALQNRIGAAFLSLELVAEGEVYIRAAIQLDPTFHAPLYNLALVLAYAGNEDAAIQTLRQGMELDPEPTHRHGFAARFFLDALADPGGALLEYRAFTAAGGADAYLDQRLGPLDQPHLYIFSSEEAGLIVGHRARRRPTAR